MHYTSKTAWRHVRRFAQFVASQEPVPRDLDALTPAMVRRWRAWLPPGADGHKIFRMVSGLLLEDPRLQAGPVADELARRTRLPQGKNRSCSEADFGQVTAVARRQFRAGLQRINENARHLQQWRDGSFAEASAESIIGEGLDILARTGDVPRYVRKDGQTSHIKDRYRNAFGTTKPLGTYLRLFLTREEAVALGVLLLAEFGWNLSVISNLEVPVASPDQGEDGCLTYRISLTKPRRGPGRHHETRNVTDHCAGSPGRLITQALEATRFARAIVGELAPGASQLMVWRSARLGRPRTDLDARPPAGPFCFGVTTASAIDWAKAAGLGGSPFRQGRRTVIALDRREPGQQSRGTYERHYVLPDEHVQAEAAEVIAAGAEDAVGLARQAVLAAELRDRHDPADAETATADCSGFRDSPWPAPDGGCGASFLMCLACPNARVHPGHHPRLACLHEALTSLRSVMPPPVWAADWRDAHDRLEDLRERVGAGPWSHALTQVAGTDRALVNHLLAGNLDA